VRSLVPALILALAAPVAAQPLWEAELRAGYGVAMGTETDMSSARHTTPLTLTALAAIAISDEPPVSVYGGITVETIARNTFGFAGGVKLQVPGMPLHLATGGVWVYAPATRWGATAAAGTCRANKALFLCGDVQLTTFVAGEAIDKGHTVTQIQLVFGLGFDLSFDLRNGGR